MDPENDPRLDDSPASLPIDEPAPSPLEPGDEGATGATTAAGDPSDVDGRTPSSFGSRHLDPSVREIPPQAAPWPAGPVARPDPLVGAVMTTEPRPELGTDRPRGRVLIPMVSAFLGAALALAAVAGIGGFDVAEESTTTTATTIAAGDQSAEAVIPPAGGTMTLQLREANVDAVAVGEVVIPSIVSVQIGQNGPTGFRTSGSGSGVVFDTDGHIITNDHVAAGGSAYQVVFADGRVYEATLVGTDPVTDLAVLEIGADDLVPIEFGSSDALSVGDPTVAIGNPLGLDGGPSLTVGVLSAFDRQVQTSASDRLHGMLQTDAPITQGSSGGALVDETGRLIGITTAVGVSEIGVEGIGFATPVEIVERVVGELIAYGEAGTAFLGIVGGTSFDTAADGALVPGGVEIGEVEAGGAAALAGLQTGDVITSYESFELETMEDLIVLLRRSSVGDVVKLTVERAGEMELIDVALGER